LFADVVGHDRIRDVLGRAIKADRLPPSLLLTGPEGIGKKTLALAVARGLLCEKGPGEPCGACTHCRRIARSIDALPDRRSEAEGRTDEPALLNHRLHPDVVLVEAWRTATRAEIKVAQVRDLVGDVVALPFEARARVFVIDDPDRGMSFAEAVVLGESMHGVLAFPGSYAPPKRAGKYKGGGVGPSPCYSFTACVVEVDVDAETGDVKPAEIWIAHDIGRALNPLLVEGQTEGSVYMGLGEALMEEQTFRKGVHKFPSMLDYKSPTTLETPEIHTILVETDDPEGPFGAKEAGQGPLLPVMPAVANAIYDAVGVRIDEVPVTPDKVLAALEKKAKGEIPRVGPESFPMVPYPAATFVLPPWEDGDGDELKGPDGKPMRKARSVATV